MHKSLLPVVHPFQMRSFPFSTLYSSLSLAHIFFPAMLMPLINHTHSIWFYRSLPCSSFSCKTHNIFFLNLFYCCSSTVFCHSLPPFSTSPVLPTSLPISIPPCYCPCVLYSCSCKPFTLSPYNPLPSPLWSLSACSQFHCLWLYFACLFCWLGSCYRWDHMVFVFHRLAYFT